MSDAKGQHEPSMEEILASIRRIIAEDNEPADAAGEKPAQDGKTAPPAAAAAPAHVALAATAAKEDDVLELTEVVEEDEPVNAPTNAAPAHADEPMIGVDADPHAAEEPPAPTAAAHDRLLSTTSAAASVAALSQLVRGQRDKSGELPLGAVDRTLEDIVRELLRPLLRDWLDEHLPKLVERLVQDEIARLVREVQGH